MIKILIKSDNPISEFKVENLSGQTVSIIDDLVYCSNDWHLLKIPYRGVKIEISDILINDVSVQHLLYTGWFENKQGKKFQPATAVWEPGNFYFWFHPNLGFMKGEIFSQIYNGDYGTNLFEKYLFTVDRPVNIPDTFPKDIQQFFATALGPKWWHKHDSYTPYQIVDNVFFGNMVNEVHKVTKLCTQEINKNNEGEKWQAKSWSANEVISDSAISNADPFKINDHSFEGFGKYFTKLGWTDVFVLIDGDLGSHGWIPIHIDDHVQSKNWKYIRNRNKLYFTYKNSDKILFKMHGVGILPIDKPLLINTADHAHCVVNLGDKIRKNFISYGAKLD